MQTVSFFGALLYADVKLVVSWVVLCPALLQTALQLHQVRSLSVSFVILHKGDGLQGSGVAHVPGCLFVWQTCNQLAVLDVNASESPARCEACIQ